MYRNVRWKLVVILAVVVGTSACAWVPPLANRLGLPLPAFMAERRLSLGLDLTGGVQFVLRVNAQEALGVDPSQTRDDVVAQAREALDRRINALGVLESVIAVQGEQRDEILIQSARPPCRFKSGRRLHVSEQIRVIGRMAACRAPAIAPKALESAPASEERTR